MQALLTKISINCSGRLLLLDKPQVMGILNLTTDSFFKDSRVAGEKQLLQAASAMLQDGAAILDIGGQSTRPGAVQVSEEEELQKVIPAIAGIRKEFPQAFISVDTFYASVARAAIENGADIVNDVSGGEEDPEMFHTVAALQVPYILMHRQGNPASMQNNPQYGNVALEIATWFATNIAQLYSLGVKDIVLDPGFGFGKTLAHNYELLNSLDRFKIFELPILAGVSRKSMIQKALHVNAEEALNGTTALHMAALLKGAAILRAHDVKEASQCVKLYQYLVANTPEKP